MWTTWITRCFTLALLLIDPHSLGLLYLRYVFLNYLNQCYNPSLLYSCETCNLRSCDEKRVEVAWNNAFSENAYWHESVKPLQYCRYCLPISIFLPTKKLLFWKKMLCSGILILCRLAKCCDAKCCDLFALAAKFHIEPHDVVRSSVARIKDSFWF